MLFKIYALQLHYTDVENILKRKKDVGHDTLWAGILYNTCTWLLDMSGSPLSGLILLLSIWGISAIRSIDFR